MRFLFVCFWGRWGGGGGGCRVGWLNLLNAVLSVLFSFFNGCCFRGGLLVHMFLFGCMYLFVFSTQRKVGEEIQTYITPSWRFCPVESGTGIEPAAQSLCPVFTTGPK